TRKMCVTQLGTSCDSQVSSCDVPGRPLTHSVSTPEGISTCGETINADRIRFAATCAAMAASRLGARGARLNRPPRAAAAALCAQGLAGLVTGHTHRPELAAVP